MKKVLLLVMVLCFGMLVIPTQATVYYELWGLVPPGDGLVDIDWLVIPAPDGHLDSDDVPVAATGELDNFSTGAFSLNDDVETYTYRQIGILNIATAGDYNFWCNSDDGSLIFIDGVLVADYDGWHGAEEVVEGVDPGYGKTLVFVDELFIEHPIATPLSAGPHLIEVLMFEDGGGDSLDVRYAMSTDEFEAVFIDDADLSLPVVPVTPASWEVDVPLSGATLEWTNPLGATQFNVYFGTDPNEIDTFSMLPVDGTSTTIGELAGGDLVNDTRYFVLIDTIAEPNNVMGALFAFDSMRMAPIITGDPVSASVGPGGCLVAFSVTATSGINDDGGELSYQWYDDAVALDGEIGDTLVTDIAGSYDCVVTSSWGEATSATASLTIVPFGMPAATLANGLIGYWPFDVDGTDASGNGVDGDLTGNAKITTGLFGNALECDGSDGAMLTDMKPSDLGIGGANPRSVSCWAYSRSWGDRGLYDMGTRSAGQNFSLRLTSGDANHWRVQYWGDPDWDFRTTNGTDWDGMNMAGDYTFDCLDNWVHWVHTYDSSGTKIYGNGVLLVSYGDAIDTGDGDEWRIGVYNGNEWDGWIDDVALWDRAITAGEVAALYSAGQAGGTLAGPSWAPINPQYSPGLNASGWFDPTVDLTLSWENAAAGPCGDGVTYDVIWTTDETVANDPNAEPYITVSDMTAMIPTAELNYEGEYYVRVDVNFDGDSDQGDVWYVEAVKLVPDIVSQPQNSGLVLQDGTAIFSVETASDTTVTYEWFMEVADGSDLSIGTGVTEVNINTLTLVGVGIPDDGMVYCIATNGSGPKQTDSARLEIGQLIGHWTMDAMEDSVDAEGAAIKIIADSSPFGRDGIAMGDPNLPIVVAGKIGTAIEFNSGETGQWMDVGLLASELGIGGSHAKTVSAWVYTKEFNNGGLFDMGNRGSGENFSLRTLDTDHRWRLQYWGGDYDFQTDDSLNMYDAPESWNAARPDPVPFPSLDAWVHFVHVYDGATSKVYGNGRLVALYNRTLNTGDAFTFRLAAYGPDPSSTLPAVIDDVRLYNYALSATQAAELYLEVEGGSSCPEDPIYDFNGDCETTMVDFAMFMEGWMECNLIQCY